MDELWHKINRAIHERDPDLARNLLPRYLAAHQRSPTSIYEASEFLRKLGDYRGALRLLPEEGADATPKLRIQLARILNALGASRYALRMIDRLGRERALFSTVEVAEINVSNGRYQETLKLTEGTKRLPASEPWHRDWLLHFYRADALCGTGDPDGAIRIVEKVRTISESPLIRAICSCAQGEYLTQAGEPEKALPHLREAAAFFKRGDATQDHAILRKWLGICLVQLDSHRLAETALDQAFQLFYRPGLKPEGWMEALLWRDRLPRFQGSPLTFTPRFQSLFPGNSPLATRCGLTQGNSAGRDLSLDSVTGPRKLRHLDPSTDTAWRGKTPRLGLDQVDKLVATLVYAGPLGMPQYWLYEHLWPEEPFAFAQLQKRLEQLVLRARKSGYRIQWEDLHLRLLSRDVSAARLAERVIRGRTFLDGREQFATREVEAYFSISRASATSLCRSWLSSGQIRAVARSTWRVAAD